MPLWLKLSFLHLMACTPVRLVTPARYDNVVGWAGFWPAQVVWHAMVFAAGGDEDRLPTLFKAITAVVLLVGNSFVYGYLAALAVRLVGSAFKPPDDD